MKCNTMMLQKPPARGGRQPLAVALRRIRARPDGGVRGRACDPGPGLRASATRGGREVPEALEDVITILKAAAYAIPRGAPNAEWGQKFFATMAKPENQGRV